MDGIVFNSLTGKLTFIGCDVQHGVPIRRFTKQLIKAGTYHHPQDKWTLDMTRNRMERVVASTNRAIENGVAIPVPDGHSDLSAKNNHGWAKNFRVVDDAIVADVELIGDQADGLSQRADVSIFLDPDFRDGKGNSYGETITHVALTPTPVVPGLDGFIPVAAARKELTRARLFSYASNNSTGASTMNLDAIRSALGADGTLTADNLHEFLTKRLSTEQTDKDKLNGEVTALKAKVAELEKKQPPTVDAEALEDRADGILERIDSLVEKGRITTAVAASLKPILTGAPKARPAFMLSRTASGTDQPIARQIIDALSKNDPVELGEKTKRQGGTALSRETPGSNEPSAADKQRTDSILADMRVSAGLAPAGAK